jgi:nucleotide-binding universal stress UspA family protein
VTEEAAAPAANGAAILLCYDGSDGAKRAIEVAHAVAGDRRVTVLHLWEPPGGLMLSDPFGGLPVWSPDQISEVDAVVRERAGRLVADGVRIAREAGFEAQGRLEASPGSDWRAILDVADELDAQLIVLGARGLSAVESAILGSVSNAIVHHAKRPVLVGPPAEGEAGAGTGCVDPSDPARGNLVREPVDGGAALRSREAADSCDVCMLVEDRVRRGRLARHRNRAAAVRSGIANDGGRDRVAAESAEAAETAETAIATAGGAAAE